MLIPIYQVDAFAERVFEGNPAAVVPLQAWLADALLQKVAAENNLSETAFFVPTARGFHLRWFTPTKEIDLCGHATLAAAHVLYHHLDYRNPNILFETGSGDLLVSKTGLGISMDFPSDMPHELSDIPLALLQGLTFESEPKKGALVQVLAAADYIVVLANADAVKALKPDLLAWSTLDLRGVVVTAQGNTSHGVDFVSRAFFPKYGIDEDPVTGSAHCALLPYWGKNLGVNMLQAYQCSKRGGMLHGVLRENRVVISGKAVDYMVGKINIVLAKIE